MAKKYRKRENKNKSTEVMRSDGVSGNVEGAKSNGAAGQKPVGRPRKENLQKVEELKLGRFAECEPLLLPEKETKRGWQIFWGVVLLLLAVAGVVVLVGLVFSEEIFKAGTPVQSWQARLATGGLYWEVALLALLVASVMSVVAGMTLLMKKRVPVWVWYMLIAAIVVGLVSISFRTFRWYEERRCYENYPGIYPENPNMGSGCPSVVGSLSLIVLKDLAIYTVGIVALFLVRRADRMRLKHPKRSKRKRR